MPVKKQKAASNNKEKQHTEVERTEKGRWKKGNSANPATKFTPDKQPAPEAKKAGMKRRKFTREVIKEMLNMPYRFTPDSLIKNQLIAAFGKGVLSLSSGEVMALQQMQKGVLKADSRAVELLYNQSFGLPKQTTQLENPDGSGVLQNKSDDQLKEMLQQTLSKLNDSK